jgi:hypothetical protein
VTELLDEPYIAITVAQANEVLMFVDLLRPHLQLTHYNVLLRSQHDNDNDPETGGDSGAFASFKDTDGRPVGVLKVRPSMFELNLAGKRHCIIHELLHAAHSRTSQTVYRKLWQFESQVGSDKIESAWADILIEFEYHTDTLANAMTPLVPVGWPTTKAADVYAAKQGWDLAWHNDMSAHI